MDSKKSTSFPKRRSRRIRSKNFSKTSKNAECSIVDLSDEINSIIKKIEMSGLKKLEQQEKRSKKSHISEYYENLENDLMNKYYPELANEMLVLWEHVNKFQNSLYPLLLLSEEVCQYHDRNCSSKLEKHGAKFCFNHLKKLNDFISSIATILITEKMEPMFLRPSKLDFFEAVSNLGKGKILEEEEEEGEEENSE